jgi:dCMP deaminase
MARYVVSHTAKKPAAWSKTITKNGTRVDGANIYVTASPCWNCFKCIANTGITRVVFGEFYRDERIFEVARQLGIALVDATASA